MGTRKVFFRFLIVSFGRLPFSDRSIRSKQNKTKQNKTKQLLFPFCKDSVYFLLRHSEWESRTDTQAEGEAGSMLGARRGTLMPGLQDQAPG